MARRRPRPSSARQLNRLAQLEDPANTSPTAIAYREMLAAAKASAVAGTRTARGWGEYSACGDPRKRRKAAS